MVNEMKDVCTCTVVVNVLLWSNVNLASWHTAATTLLKQCFCVFRRPSKLAPFQAYPSTISLIPSLHGCSMGMNTDSLIPGLLGCSMGVKTDSFIPGLLGCSMGVNTDSLIPGLLGCSMGMRLSCC